MTLLKHVILSKCLCLQFHSTIKLTRFGGIRDCLVKNHLPWKPEAMSLIPCLIYIHQERCRKFYCPETKASNISKNERAPKPGILYVMSTVWVPQPRKCKPRWEPWASMWAPEARVYVKPSHHKSRKRERSGGISKKKNQLQNWAYFYFILVLF